MDVVVEKDKEQKKGKAPADAEEGGEEEEVEVVSSLQGTSCGQTREHYAGGKIEWT